MTERGPQYFSFKAKGKPSPMVLCVESYDHDTVARSTHDGFELYWSLNNSNPSASSAEDGFNGCLPKDTRVILIDAPNKSKEFEHECVYVCINVLNADECHSLRLIGTFGSRLNQGALI